MTNELNTSRPLSDAALLGAKLKRGQLNVTVKTSDIEPRKLFAFAERRNPKRAFLFVSRVLGRHIPTRPSDMQGAAAKLAGKIPVDLPGPVLVIGMAETAVGLGAAVHRELANTRTDSVYLTTTRHPVDNGQLFALLEDEHSHASLHMLYQPRCDKARALMMNARSLVLVDDEVSTGQTFINLMAALRNVGLNTVERVVTAALTDWSNNSVSKVIGDTVTSVALLEGHYSFVENKNAPLPHMPDVSTVEPGFWPITTQQNWGREGTLDYFDTLAPHVTAAPGEKILVIGTGEFVWRPFLLAERLEKAGADVHFSSTTRSPIAIGHAIKSAFCFADNYGLGIPNYLYNVDPSAYDRIFICSETSAEALDGQLLADLGAIIITEEQGLSIFPSGLEVH